MNSSPRTVLRGSGAAQAVTFTPDALTDLQALMPVEASDDDAAFRASAHTGGAFAASGPATAGMGESGRPTGRLHFDQVYADQMAALREQARREGFEAGHAEGMNAATQAVDEMVLDAQAQVQAEQDDWRARAQTALHALDAAAAAFDARTAPTMDEMTTSLSQAAYTLVSDLLDRELVLAADPTRDAVERALRLVPADAPVTVRINTRDHASLDPEWVASLRGTVTLVPDSTVEPAGAVAESGARRVDAQLATALHRVREVLDS